MHVYIYIILYYILLEITSSCVSRRKATENSPSIDDFPANLSGVSQLAMFAHRRGRETCFGGPNPNLYSTQVDLQKHRNMIEQSHRLTRGTL